MNRRGGSAGGSAGLRPALTQASGTTPKGKGFVIKSWEDSQKMGIVSGGGSHWSSNKQSKTGETASGNGKKASGGTGASSKPVEKPPESKPSSGSASSSKPNAGNAATTSKNNTTSKTNPEKNETPNEVNTWKPSTKKKGKREPQANTNPPKSPETNKPEENPKTNKTKDNSKGTEGTGKDLLSPNGKFIDSKLESDYQKYLARKAKEGKRP
ncbi:hypothetical protein [Paenibacillus sp. TC-CSREp1]|uniref:hypothetical protein n=1 Tax=Paenibacillus sp. TC-CSREp1 TaxID=3410089 RepID=UPI003D086E6F